MGSEMCIRDRERLKTLSRVLVANGIEIVRVKGALSTREMRAEVSQGDYVFGVQTSKDRIWVWGTGGGVLAPEIVQTLGTIASSLDYCKMFTGQLRYEIISADKLKAKAPPLEEEREPELPQKRASSKIPRFMEFLWHTAMAMALIGSFALFWVFPALPMIAAGIPALNVLTRIIFYNFFFLFRGSALLKLIVTFLVPIITIGVLHGIYLFMRYFAFKGWLGKHELLPELDDLPDAPKDIMHQPSHINGWKIVYKKGKDIWIHKDTFRNMPQFLQLAVYRHGLRHSAIDEHLDLATTSARRLILSSRMWKVPFTILCEPYIILKNWWQSFTRLLTRRVEGLALKEYPELPIPPMIKEGYTTEWGTVEKLTRGSRLKLTDGRYFKVIGLPKDVLQKRIEALKGKDILMVIPRTEGEGTFSQAYVYYEEEPGVWTNLTHSWIRERLFKRGQFYSPITLMQKIDMGIPFILTEPGAKIGNVRMAAPSLTVKGKIERPVLVPSLTQAVEKPAETPEGIVAKEAQEKKVAELTRKVRAPPKQFRRILPFLLGSLIPILIGAGIFFLGPFLPLALIPISSYLTTALIGIGVTGVLSGVYALHRSSKNMLLGEDIAKGKLSGELLPDLGISDRRMIKILRDVGISSVSELTPEEWDEFSAVLTRSDRKAFEAAREKEAKEGKSFMRRAFFILPKLLDSFYFRFFRLPAEYEAVKGKRDFLGEDERERILRNLLLKRKFERSMASHEAMSELLTDRIDPVYPEREKFITIAFTYVRNPKNEQARREYFAELENYHNWLLKQGWADALEKISALKSLVDQVELSNQRTFMGRIGRRIQNRFFKKIHRALEKMVVPLAALQFLKRRWMFALISVLGAGILAALPIGILSAGWKSVSYTHLTLPTN